MEKMETLNIRQLWGFIHNFIYLFFLLFCQVKEKLPFDKEQIEFELMKQRGDKIKVKINLWQYYKIL